MKTATADPTPELMASRPIGYFGHRKSGRAQVFRRTRAGSETGPVLDPQLGIRRHSPSGLEWGYMGSGAGSTQFGHPYGLSWRPGTGRRPLPRLQEQHRGQSPRVRVDIEQ